MAPAITPTATRTPSPTGDPDVEERTEVELDGSVTTSTLADAGVEFHPEPETRSVTVE